eukprot:6337211-Prymnesium_polylepis.1
MSARRSGGCTSSQTRPGSRVPAGYTPSSTKASGSRRRCAVAAGTPPLSAASSHCRTVLPRPRTGTPTPASLLTQNHAGQ